MYSKTLQKVKPVLILLLVLSITIPLLPESPIEIPWVQGSGENWLTGWNYRKSHNIGGAVSEQTDYQIKIKVQYSTDVTSLASLSKPGLMYPYVHPTAYYFNGITYIAFQGRNLNPYIMTYNHSTGERSRPIEVGTNPLTDDNHGAPSILIDDSGYIHVFFGCHETSMEYVKSTNPEDISAWTTKTDPTNKATYTHPVKNGSDIYLFYGKCAVVKEVWTREWYYMKSADGGDNWSSENKILERDTSPDYGVYANGGDLDDGKIHIVWHYVNDFAGDFENEVRFNVYHAYLKLSDGHMYDINDNDLGTSITKAEADANCLVWNSSGDWAHELICHVLSGIPYIIFYHKSGEEYIWKFTKWTGSAWTSPQIIATGTTTPRASDFIINASNDVEAYLLVDEDLEKWLYDGSSWSKDSTIINSTES